MRACGTAVRAGSTGARFLAGRAVVAVETVKLGCKTIENIKDGDGTFSMIGELFGLEEAGEVLDRLLSGRLEENPFEKDLESIMGSWDRLVGMNKH